MASLVKRGREINEKDLEISIPGEYIDRIDEILASQDSQYESRQQFIRSAIEMKLNELNSYNRKQKP